MNKSKLLTLTILVAFAIILQSCATIFGGRSNTFVFEGSIDVPVEVYIDSVCVGEARGKLLLPKKVIQHGSILELKADGYETQEYTIIRKVHAWYTVADILIGGIPLAVDYGTGNILRPSPRKFEVNLQKAE